MCRSVLRCDSCRSESRKRRGRRRAFGGNTVIVIPMSTTNEISNELSVAQAVEQDEERFAVDEESAELRPRVEAEIQATVDLNHPDGVGRGLTLEAEERLVAREWEIGRTQHRIDDGQDSDREERTRDVVRKGSQERRKTFQKRAASVD